MYTLFFDSDCDITPEIAKHYGAKLISMPYEVDGKEIYPYVTEKTYNAHEFFSMLRSGKLPTTSALSPEAYREYFEPEFKKGNDILYIHFSAAMSATFNSIRLLMEVLKKEYPERKLEMIDTKGITLGSYSLCKQMGELYKQGKSIEEIKEWASINVDKTAFYFFADNLKFFAKSGRVSGFSAFMGGLIGIKPIIYISEEGKMVSIGRAKGRKNALQKILQYVIDLEEDIKKYPVVVAHGDAPELVKEFVSMMKAQFGDDLNIEVIDINPTAGSHCGPDTLGVTFHAKHR
ncbi:MAG: DegV family protein [Bacilli bacterium]|nr:DegV family protein [Bacilli bacterium]